MAGNYIEGISKVLSGVYTLIKSVISTITRGERGVAAYSFTSDWGPENVLTMNLQSNEFKALYNADKTALTAAKIYKHAYLGRPFKVLGFRMVTAAGALGTVVLNDAGAAMSLTITTLYKSARAFQAIVKDGTAGGKIVQIVEGGNKLVEVEGLTVADLVAKLNATDYVRVTASGANVPANNAGAAFAGGNNGSVVTATEYGAFLDAIEADGTANTFALDAVTDETILTTAETFVKRVRPEGFYVTFVRGGPTGWDTTIADANTKSKALNYRGIVNVGNGCEGYVAAEMAIFVAARVASVGLNRTLTDEPVPYTSVNKKLKPSQRITCKEAGTMVFVQIGDVIMIDEGVNTLTTLVLEGETLEFGKIRVSNALDYISKDLEAFGDAYKRDKSNTTEAREIYASVVEREYLAPLAALEIIRTGFYYRPDPDYHGKDAIFTPKIDEAFFIADITPVDSMERIYQKIGVNF